MEEGANPIEPINQFRVTEFFRLFSIGGADVSFTNAALFMLLTMGAVGLFLLGPTGRRALVPGRAQLMAEMSYEFIANMVRTNAGTEGMKFFPLVFTLFMFILFANVWGLFPYFFTITSQIVVTAAMALLVFGIVVGYGFYRNGLKFLRLFVPSGVPIYILPLVTAIEVISFLSRPLSHSLRLFGNMLAGHIVLEVFGGMVVALLGAGLLAPVAILPFGMAVILYALEILVAGLQAFVFAVLTCVYLHDAIHPGH